MRLLKLCLQGFILFFFYKYPSKPRCHVPPEIELSQNLHLSSKTRDLLIDMNLEHFVRVYLNARYYLTLPGSPAPLPSSHAFAFCQGKWRTCSFVRKKSISINLYNSVAESDSPLCAFGMCHTIGCKVSLEDIIYIYIYTREFNTQLNSCRFRMIKLFIKQLKEMLKSRTYL